MSLELGTICLQALIVLISLFAVFKGRKFMLGFAVGISILLYFGIASYCGWSIELFGNMSHSILLFISTACMTFSIWETYRS